MKVAGFSFEKISVEKLNNFTEKFNINTNIDIADIHSLQQEIFKTKEEFVEVKFSYTLNYNPDFAKLELVGKIIFSLESKLAKDVLKHWKDKKAIFEDFRVDLFNVILKKSNLKALQLEDEMNLPIHLTLPSIKKDDLQKAEDK